MRADARTGLGQRLRLAHDVAGRSRYASATAVSTCRKPGSPWRGSGGKYVPPKNGSPSGVRNTVIGQPPLPGQRHDGVHVDRVDVGRSSRSTFTLTKRSFISARRLGVLERLVRHHVAPVAGGVADREQDRLVLGARPRERLVAPRVPVDRVVGVLEQVRARLLGQAVHEATGGQGPAR